MYQRFTDIERVSKAMKALEQINVEDPCYSEACQQIQSQLHQAISHESGHHAHMSQYSNLNN